MKIAISDLIAFGGLFLAAATAIAAGISWHAGNEKKKYGLERDLGHIRRNQEQMQLGLTAILTEMDRRFDIVERDILEVKSVLKIPKT